VALKSGVGAGVSVGETVFVAVGVSISVSVGRGTGVSVGFEVCVVRSTAWVGFTDELLICGDIEQA
jgi:hypothetical protein